MHWYYVYKTFDANGGEILIDALRIVETGLNRQTAIICVDEGRWKSPEMQLVNPLQCAAHSGDEKLVLLLIRYGADVNSANKYGFTPLDQAAAAGRMDTVDILLKLGATKKRFQAASIAEEQGFFSIAKKIREFPITQVGTIAKV
ncbi:Ankyrin-1 [Arthrobotrys entomopaga]|nr:Ankyrin-1 [Arthrobotrys entomopaga]